MYVLNIEIIYFGSFEVGHVVRKTYLSEKHKNKIFRIQGNSSMICGYFCIRFIDFMLSSKILIDYTSLFLLMILAKMMILFWVILKMNKCNFIKVTNTYFNLSDQTIFRLNKINKIKE